MMAAELDALTDQVNTLTVALEQFGVFNLNASKKMGIFEKQKAKISTAIKKSPIMGMVTTLRGYGKAIGNVTKITGQNVTMTADQKEEHRKGMTVMQKIVAGTIAHGLAQKMSNKVLKIANNRFTRMMTTVFSLVSIFLIIGFALAALSIAFEGANSPVLTMTENFGPLHDAMQGLVLVITGEGDEGGMASALDILAAGLLAAGIASLVLGGTVGIIVGAFVIAAGVAQMFNNEFDNVYASIGVGIGVFTSLIGVVLIVKAIFVSLKTGALIAIRGTVGGVVLGVGLVIAGVAGLVAFAMGAGSGIKAVILAILSAVAIGVGLFLIGVAIVPAAIVAGIALLIAIVIRNWDTIVAFLKSAYDWLVGLGGLIWFGALAGLALIAGYFVAWGTLLIGIILFPFLFVWNFVAGMWASFKSAKKKGWSGIVSWLKTLPITVVTVAINAAKKVFNGVAGIYNSFAKKMKFDIPDWVPLIGGKSFNLPTIPKLAKGGVVNSPTLAMIGEDGPEAVVPLNRKNNPSGLGMGGGTTININVGGVTDRTDKRALAKEIGDLIRAEMTRGGRSHGNRRSGV
tara:strand:+ start:4909 stop:6621 length:1713 start_codon:yes stop_codon:yes gene_type:complete